MSDGTIKPSFNPLPNVKLNEPLPPFKAWVQMAIPTVYDDSLSYSELLYKVINYLNTTNEHLTLNDTTIKAFYDFLYGTEAHDYEDGLYNEIVKWFDDLDVDDTVNAKVEEILDRWATDGTIDNKLVALFRDPFLTTVVDTATAWLDENVDPSTGYVIDKSLSVANSASDALVVGNGLRNIGAPYWSGAVRNIEIGGNGYSSNSRNNALLYQYVKLDMSKNQLIIYPKNIINDCYVRVAFTNVESPDQSALLPDGYQYYGTSSSRITFDSPLVFTYDNTGNQVYARISITVYPNSTVLSPIADSDLINIKYNNSLIDRIVAEAKSEIDTEIETLSETIVKNGISKAGILAYSENPKNQRLAINDGSGIADSNSILFGYSEIPSIYKNLVLWCDTDITYARVTFYSEDVYTSFIATRRINNPHTPVVIPIDSTYKYLRISITSNNALDLVNDYTKLKVCYSDSTFYDENKFNIKNYNNALDFTTTEGYWILENGTIQAQSTFNYKTVEVEPYCDYQLMFTKPSQSAGVVRVHSFYNDTWVKQILSKTATGYTEPLVFNSGASNNIRVSMNNQITGFAVFKIANRVISGGRNMELTDEKSFVLKGAKVSILGASISTFIDTIPEGYAYHYPTGDVKCVNNMYWQKFINIIGGELLINNSKAGRTCSTGISAQQPYAACRTDQCMALHKTEIIEEQTVRTDPDIIIIQVGGNDFSLGVTLGDYDGTTALPVDDSDSSEVRPPSASVFANAYAIMLNKILTTYPKAKVLCGTIVPLKQTSASSNRRVSDTFPARREFDGQGGASGSGDGVALEDFNNKIRELAKAFGCYVVEFYGNGRTFQNIPEYTHDNLQHPNDKGMSLMCNALLDTFGQLDLNYFNV